MTRIVFISQSCNRVIFFALRTGFSTIPQNICICLDTTSTPCVWAPIISGKIPCYPRTHVTLTLHIDSVTFKIARLRHVYVGLPKKSPSDSTSSRQLHHKSVTPPTQSPDIISSSDDGKDTHHYLRRTVAYIHFIHEWRNVGICCSPGYHSPNSSLVHENMASPSDSYQSSNVLHAVLLYWWIIRNNLSYRCRSAFQSRVPGCNTAGPVKERRSRRGNEAAKFETENKERALVRDSWYVECDD